MKGIQEKAQVSYVKNPIMFQDPSEVSQGLHPDWHIGVQGQRDQIVQETDDWNTFRQRRPSSDVRYFVNTLGTKEGKVHKLMKSQMT